MLTFKTTRALTTVFALLLSTALVGCNSGKKDSVSKDKTGTAKKDDHAKDGHSKDEHAGHDHPSEGPHHGHLIELGNEEYHGELLHSEKTHSVTIYILDGSATKEVPIAMDAVKLNVVVDGKPTQFVMKAVGAADGKASQFVVEDANLVHAFEDDKVTKGKLTLTIEGKPFVGNIEHHAHGEHEHGEHKHAEGEDHHDEDGEHEEHHDDDHHEDHDHEKDHDHHDKEGDHKHEKDHDEKEAK
jgi:hypothetical protein